VRRCWREIGRFVDGSTGVEAFGWHDWICSEAEELAKEL
jgi:hypothetical protein